MDLPGEIRNAVWRSVVFEWGDQRTIDIDRHYMPRVMFVSKQLFNEVGHIWHNEIQFTIAIQSFKFRFSPKTLHWIWTRVPSQNVTLALQGVFSWSNLKKWLQAYHEGAVGGIGYDPLLLDDRKDSRTLSLMFDSVKAMSDVPWPTVEAVLEDHKEMLAIADPVWKRRFGV